MATMPTRAGALGAVGTPGTAGAGSAGSAGRTKSAKTQSGLVTTEDATSTAAELGNEDREMLRRLVEGHRSSAVLYVAAKLELADLLSGGSRTSEELAQRDRCVSARSDKADKGARWSRRCIRPATARHKHVGTRGPRAIRGAQRALRRPWRSSLGADRSSTTTSRSASPARPIASLTDSHGLARTVDCQL